MKTVRNIVLFLVLSTLLFGYGITHGQSPAPAFSRQFGTSVDDDADAVAADSQGNVVVVGGTSGSLNGANAGSDDIFINKYASNGASLWSQQIGSPQEDVASSNCIDSNGNIYIGGLTVGNLFSSLTGTRDAFIVKYDALGKQIWNKQFGVTGSDCGVGAVALDSQGNIYAVGFTSASLFGPNSAPSSYDCFLIKYTPAGSILWSKQFGSVGQDLPSGIAVDGQGNVYVSGNTEQLYAAPSGHDDAFVAKLDQNGTLLWGKQFGGINKYGATSIAVDSGGNAYVTGYNCTGASDDLSQTDAFITKLDANGNTLWRNSLSSGEGDLTTRVVLDVAGNVIVTGYTSGNMFGPSSGGKNVFLVKYNAIGNVLWDEQIGVSTDDEATDICTDSTGNIYIAGHTAGSLFASNMGGDDAFLAKFSSSGQIADSNVRYLLPYKPLLFAWADTPTRLLYPPLLIQGKPYVDAAYLACGTPGAKVTFMGKGPLTVDGTPKVVLTPGVRRYTVGGRPRTMTAKPVLVEGQCYVPLDVAKAALPFPVSFTAKARTVRFDPPQPRQARK